MGAATYDIRILTPNIVERFDIVLGVLYQDIHHKIGLAVLLGKVSSLFVVPALSTHCNCCIKVKFEVARRLDELFKLVYVFELCITVEEKSRVVRSRFSMFMELFQILN